jgi:hypothetical protein
MLNTLILVLDQHTLPRADPPSFLTGNTFKEASASHPPLLKYPHLVPILDPLLFILLLNLKSNPINQFLMTTLNPSSIIDEIV